MSACPSPAQAYLAGLTPARGLVKKSITCATLPSRRRPVPGAWPGLQRGGKRRSPSKEQDPCHSLWPGGDRSCVSRHSKSVTVSGKIVQLGQKVTPLPFPPARRGNSLSAKAFPFTRRAGGHDRTPDARSLSRRTAGVAGRLVPAMPGWLVEPAGRRVPGPRVGYRPGWRLSGIPCPRPEGKARRCSRVCLPPRSSVTVKVTR